MPTEVERLLDSLKTEGHLYLLFLKSIECIEFHHKAKGAAKPTLVYRTSIAEKDRELVRRERSAFFGCNGSSASTTYKCDITTELHSKQEKRFSYLVGLQMDYGGQLASYSQRLNYLPTMGAALSLNGPDLEVSSGGQLFCFLPMPLETESPTGLNVHVHGYFALDQNRRHLKLPSAEQKDHVVDEQLIWNGLLIQELLPECLISLIIRAIQDKDINDHHVCFTTLRYLFSVLRIAR
jgi:sacsin